MKMRSNELKRLRTEALSVLSRSCERCKEDDKMLLDVVSDESRSMKEIYSDVIGGNTEGYSVLCGNCLSLKEWHNDIFSTVVPKGIKTNFDIDLSYGKQREHRFSQILSSTIEVKSDRKARETGNVYIEYESRGSKSGVSTTAAKFWAQEIDEDVFIVMPVERLRAIVKDKLDKYGVVYGGDNLSSKGVLLRVSEMTKPIKEFS